MQTKKLIGLLCIILLIFSCYLMFFFLKISYLAYLSTKAECGQIPICSTDFSSSYSPESKEITVNLQENDKNYYSVLIHEIVHAKQDSEGKLSTCEESLVLVFANEFKAYFMEELA